MTPEEIVVLSAKSAGIELEFQNGAAGRRVMVGNQQIWTPWEPHDNPADAMHLLVKHQMQINSGIVSCYLGSSTTRIERAYPLTDKYDTAIDQATRVLCMAIAELAADIGRMMP
ncbi:hypothetical protein [Pseudomonas putida]|uniref:hypothetical protein n=1 Tax=Pseudomonas putida TaxID=303 RepID=UPI0018D7A345|nr:hypothetical protein [Pseudomonas putida]MBH3412542.1 hypothetical protein [Pseudomonas putida]